MRFVRMIRRHLLEHPAHVLQNRRRCMPGDQRAEPLAIGFGSWRQPEGGTAEVVHAIRAAVLERLPTEGVGYLRHDREVLRRVGEGPARHRIRTEPERDHIQHRFPIAYRADPDLPLTHDAFPLSDADRPAAAERARLAFEQSSTGTVGCYEKPCW